MNSQAAEIAQSFLIVTAFYLLLTCIYLTFILWMLWSVIKNERGADRLAWMGTVVIPIIGILAFFILLPEERKKREEAERYAKALEWAAKKSAG